MNFLIDRRKFRFLSQGFNFVRLKLIKYSRILTETFVPQTLSSTKMVILNIQYINAYSEIELLMGKALKRQGYAVKAIICPGLEYCEREDHSTPRPNCDECQKECKQYCDAYGIDFFEPATHSIDANTAPEYSEFQKFPKIAKAEYVHRSYIHFCKSYSEFDRDLWIRIENSINFFSKYLLCLKLGSPEVERVITSNGKFFQTGLPLDLIVSNNGFITTEAFGIDDKVILGRNTHALNQHFEIDRSTLENVEIDELFVDSFLNEQGVTPSKKINVWSEGREESHREISKELKTREYEKVVCYFPNVIWDSVWLGIGYFDYSPAITIKTLNALAGRFTKTLFLVRSHPAEVNVPKKLKATGSISSDLSLSNVCLRENVTIIPSHSKLSSYAIADLSDEIIVWNTTLGLELMCSGRRVLTLADGFYSLFGPSTDVKSVRELESVLAGPASNHLSKEEVQLARKMLFINRNLKRFKSPIHLGARPVKLCWWSMSYRESRFTDSFMDYFDGRVDAIGLVKKVEG